MMKKYIYCIVAAVSAFFLAGCNKDNPASVDRGIVGEWHLTSWNGTDPAGDFDVYVSFGADGAFDLYQRVETSVYVRYSGSFSAENGTVSGTYSDGEPWSAGYAYEIGADGNTLTLTSGDDVSIYTRTPVPEDVKTASGASVKSASGGMKRFF